MLVGHQLLRRGVFLERLLEHGVLDELLLDVFCELEPRQLQQLDRLLQLRRHHQLLARELDWSARSSSAIA